MSTTLGISAMFGDHDPNMYAISGALLPRTAVSTFCSTWSLGVASWVTWTSGCSLLYWSISLVKLSACTSVQPCQIVILVGPPADSFPPPPPPHAATRSVSTAIRARKMRGRVTSTLLHLEPDGRSESHYGRRLYANAQSAMRVRAKSCQHHRAGEAAGRVGVEAAGRGDRHGGALGKDQLRQRVEIAGRDGGAGRLDL